MFGYTLVKKSVLKELRTAVVDANKMCEKLQEYKNTIEDKLWLAETLKNQNENTAAQYERLLLMVVSNYRRIPFMNTKTWARKYEKKYGFPPATAESIAMLKKFIDGECKKMVDVE